jgi:hypothetical protein
MQESLEMGLTTMETGLYEYRDRYSAVWYEILRGVTRDLELPSLAIFTGEPNTPIDDRQYVGAVSTEYKFFGNAMAVDAVMDSIKNLSSGDNNLRERVIFSANRTQMSCELMIINSQTKIGESGTVVPLINIENSYNGSKAAMYSFGMGIVDAGYNMIGSISFKKKILGMRQIHILCSNTSLESNIGSYIDVFNSNITDLVNENFNKVVPPEDAMKALGMVEKLGKRRHAAIVHNLASLTNNGQDFDEDNIPPINAWNMFMAIATYSCREENINAKKMLDSIAERTLNIPTKMLASLQ